jgi:hypothetical protein
VCQGRDSLDDETVDQTEKNSQGGNKKGSHDVEDKHYPSDKINNSSHNSNLGTKTEHKRQLPVSSESDMLSTDVNAHSPPSYKTRGSPRGARYGLLSNLYANRITHYLVHIFVITSV